MKKLIFLVPVILLAAAACSKQEAAQNNQLTDNQQQIQTQTAETQNQTYKSSKYGFEFQYPTNWKIFSSGSSHTVIVPTADNTNLNAALDIWSGSNINHGAPGLGAECGRTSVTVAGVKADKVVNCGANPSVFSGKEYESRKDARFVSVYFTKNGVEYGLELYMRSKDYYHFEQEVFDKALSTFKFTK